MLLAGVYQLCSALLLCFWPTARQFQKVDQVERGTAVQVIGVGLGLATGLRKPSIHLDPEEQHHLLLGGGSFIPKMAKT